MSVVAYFLAVLGACLAMAEVVNLTQWWRLFGRPRLAPWNWRVLAGPRPYTSWVIGELVEQEIFEALGSEDGQ